MKFVLQRVENIMGKGENADYQHFFLCLQCFQKPSSLKVGMVWQRVNKKVMMHATVARKLLKRAEMFKLLKHYQMTKFWIGPN